MNFIAKCLTQEQFLERVAKVNPDVEILSEYTGNKNDVVRRCKICGDIRTLKAKSILEGRGCIICMARKHGKELRKTNEQFIKDLSAVNTNILPLEEYVANDRRIKCRCLIDGFEWDAVPHVLLQNHGCPKCSDRKQHRRTHEEYIEYLASIKPSIEILSEYVNNSTKVDFRCKDCGYEWTAVPPTVAYNKLSGCPRCDNHAFVTEKDFIERIAKANEYNEYISGYTNTEGHVNMRCRRCGYEWRTSARHVMEGGGCPHCCLSRGERRIAKYLKDNNICYITQYRFSDCVNVRQLPFDFYLPDLNMCIEYDGEQHFRPIKFKGHTQEEADEKYEGVVLRDGIKNQYCKDNQIKLIRIPYTEYNEIEEKLDKLLA